MFLHWDDPRLINDTVACIPVVLTIVIAFVPNLSKAHTIWRIGIVAVGLAWSILLWKQQVQAGHDQENAMARVLKEANEHSDKQMATRIATLPGDVANAVVLKMSPQKTRGTIEIPSSKPAKEASAPSVKNENQTADQKSTAEDVARGLQDIKNLIVGQHWGLTEDQLMFLSQK